MKNITILVQTCLMSLLFVSCNEYSGEVSPIAVFVTPNKSDTIRIDAGGKVKYDLSFYADKGYVNRFQITSFDSYYGEVLCKDTNLCEKTCNYTYIYSAPLTDKDSLDVVLKFYAWNSEGDKCETERYIVVKSKTVLLDEKRGIVLWQPSLFKPDALCFSDPSKTFHWETSSDSIKADIYLEGDELLREVQLKSKTKTKFVRNNSFDYASATALTVSNVYASSLRTEEVTNLSLNDIILVGHNNNAEGVFQVTNIVRGNTSDGCCIHLSFKALK